MKISLIVAMAENRVIGRDNSLPWHLSDDLKSFRRITMNKPVVMGRKTHESIGRPLPGRQNIVISRNSDYQAEGCTVCHDLNEAFRLCAAEEEVVVIGGHAIYRLALERAHRIYLTEVHAEIEGDVSFPDFNRGEWDEIERVDYPADDRNDYPFTTLLLEKRHPLYW